MHYKTVQEQVFQNNNTVFIQAEVSIAASNNKCKKKKKKSDKKIEKI